MSERRVKQMRKIQANQNGNSGGVLGVSMEERSYSGPIPEASELEQYNKIIPGAGERILSMAENQSHHRMELEKKLVNGAIVSQTLGVLFGGIIGISTIVGSVICILNGYEWSGAILGTGGLTSLVGVFVYGTQIERKNDTK